MPTSSASRVAAPACALTAVYLGAALGVPVGRYRRPLALIGDGTLTSFDVLEGRDRETKEHRREA